MFRTPGQPPSSRTNGAEQAQSHDPGWHRQLLIYTSVPDQVDKARSWLNRAVLLEPDVGDFWALLAKFEAQHGTPDTQAAVVERLKAAEPRHGERWQRVAKDPANAHLPIETILKKVVLDIDKEPPP